MNKTCEWLKYYLGSLGKDSERKTPSKANAFHSVDFVQLSYCIHTLHTCKRHRSCHMLRDTTHRKATDSSTRCLKVCLNTYTQELMLIYSYIFVTNQTKNYLNKVKVGSSKHKFEVIYGRSTL